MARPLSCDFLIWTTTPWTLPANQALVVHPTLDYVLAEVPGGPALVVAEGLLPAVAQRLGVEAVVLAVRPGAALEGLMARHPYLDHRVPVILGEHVTLDTGTGIVHTAPAHGAEDYIVGLRYHLPVETPLEGDGRFRADAPVVGGLFVRAADEPVIEALKAAGALAAHAFITHSYPHCWRHKSPLIFRATPQWFISMDAQGLREQALSEIAKTRWIPAWGENRIREMVAQRPDWCVSRQRFWGVPLALFVDRETQDMHPQSADLLWRVAQAVEAGGLDAWFESEDGQWLGADASRYTRVTDTLDVWFDSGCVHQGMFASVMPQAMHDHTGPIADLYLEGSDQHRGWFQSSLLCSVAMQGRAPYKAVLTHGFTVDEQGRKMSKSLGNVVSPQKVMQELGADVLRLWVAASDYRGEIAVSPELLKRMADAYRRLRNTARYLLGNLHDFDPGLHAVPHAQLLAIDRWALAQARRLQDDVVRAYRQSEFHLVYQRLHNYCIVDLGGLYLDVLKDRLYTLPAQSPARRSAQTAMFHIAHALVRWISPILSFTADEIWRGLPGTGEGTVFEQTWHVFPAAQAGVDLSDPQWSKLLAVREVLKKLLEERRVAGEIGGSLDAAVTCYAEGDLYEALAACGEEARYWFITSEFVVHRVGVQPDTAVERDLESGERLWLEVHASRNGKCARCWHLRLDVGTSEAHPTLCGRCVENVYGQGESRRYM
jgi:isoleucyl-tRNA synthetase